MVKMVVPFNAETNDEDSRLMTPSAPPLDTQDPNQYIDFQVIDDSNINHIIRGEKKPIIENSIELAKIINGSISTRRINGNHVITGVNKDDFELFIRFLETKFIRFRDWKHTLEILEITNRFNCSDLVIVCIKELDKSMDTVNVIGIFRALWYYSAISPAMESLEKPKKLKKKHLPATLKTPEEYMSALLTNCVQLIDMEAEKIFEKPEMLDLRFEELEMIVKRNALQIESELILFEFLANWSRKECEKKKLDLTAENRRRVLGALCYTPRYLIMSERDFEKSCDRAELLDSAETKLVRDFIKGKKNSNLTTEQSELLANFKKPRPIYAKLPIYLSSRSDPKNYSRKMRNYDNPDKGCCSSFTLTCISIFACIFD